jgi:thiamine-phosphate diphosphorylase/hydroxyethylthiazole kinase
MHGSVSRTNHGLDGVAVVSDIIKSSDPEQSAKILKNIFAVYNKPAHLGHSSEVWPRETILDKVASIMDGARKLNPLVHQVNPLCTKRYQQFLTVNFRLRIMW